MNNSTDSISNLIICHFCGDENEAVISYDLSTDKIDLGLPGLILECKNCTMQYKYFSKDLIKEVYNDDYSDSVLESEYMTGYSVFFNTVLSGSRFYNAGTNKKKNNRLLDLGSGGGTLLECASKMGFEVHGVELNDRLAHKCIEKGFNVTKGYIEEIDFGNRKFEVITMIDIIEHLPNPVAVLNKVKELLVPDGELIVYTPNHKSSIVSFAHFLFKCGIKSPVISIFGGNHVSFFDEKNLTNILFKSGFIIDNLIITKYDRSGSDLPKYIYVFLFVIEFIGSCFRQKKFRMLAYAKSLPLQ